MRVTRYGFGAAWSSTDILSCRYTPADMTVMLIYRTGNIWLTYIGNI